MSKRLVIGSGWFADDAGHNNPAASRQLYKSDFMLKWWNINFKNKLEGCDPHFMVYQSYCDVQPYFANTQSGGFHKIHSVMRSQTFGRYFDHWLSMIAGAFFAYANDADFLYVEQDCLVKNVDAFIAFAQAEKARICYGFGEYSFKPGWAENSLVYVANEFCGRFVADIMNSDFPRDDREFEEIFFHMLFKDYFTPWPVGYGRKHELLDFSDEALYIQQVSDDEIKQFVEMNKLGNLDLFKESR